LSPVPVVNWQWGLMVMRHEVVPDGNQEQAEQKGCYGGMKIHPLKVRNSF
jgi:hypothetical protein